MLRGAGDNQEIIPYLVTNISMMNSSPSSLYYISELTRQKILMI